MIAQKSSSVFKHLNYKFYLFSPANIIAFTLPNAVLICENKPNNRLNIEHHNSNKWSGKIGMNE